MGHIRWTDVGKIKEAKELNIGDVFIYADHGEIVDKIYMRINSPVEESCRFIAVDLDTGLFHWIDYHTKIEKINYQINVWR